MKTLERVFLVLCLLTDSIILAVAHCMCENSDFLVYKPKPTLERPEFDSKKEEIAVQKASKGGQVR